MPNTRCAGIKGDGAACRGVPIHGSSWCVAHHPDYQEQRRRGASKGGKRGGRGRPLAEVGEIKQLLRSMSGAVLAGRIDARDASVAGQLLNTCLRCFEVERRLREAEELEDRLAKLEELLEADEARGSTWGR